MKIFGRHQIVYQAQAISLESGEAFRKNQLSVLGEIRHANRRAGRAIWSAVGIMVVTAGIIIAAIVYVSPALREKIKVIYIGRVDGRIQQIDGIENKPELFTDADDANAIRDYVELYYDYTWETNRKHEERIRMLSSSDQFSRYKEWADNTATSPKQKLAHHGSSEIDRVVVRKQPDGDAKTREYVVQFSYRETTNGRTEPMAHQYTGHIQFQRHPELVRDADWASKNPEGVVVMYFKADEDAK